MEEGSNTDCHDSSLRREVCYRDCALAVGNRSGNKATGAQGEQTRVFNLYPVCESTAIKIFPINTHCKLYQIWLIAGIVGAYCVPVVTIEVSMSQSQSQPISTDKFLIMAANLLHKVLLDIPRTEAKTLYQKISKGDILQLATVKMEDESTVRFSATLDHSEFKGKLNFGAFRGSLALLVSNMGQALNDKKQVTVFTEEGDPDGMIFGITALTQEQNQVNIMVLGANTGDGQASVRLRLMYIDDGQFLEAQAVAEKS